VQKISNLPTPIKWVLAATGVGVLVGVGGIAGSGNWKLLGVFALVLLILLALFLGGYFLWIKWQKQKQNARLRGGLAQSATAAPQGMSATGLAKLDSLRKKFAEGVDAFRSRGKDIYALPWYVIIGEPGSGKTEAVRHCNVGFPPGMHEGENDTGYMGVGGTINMNWWFTNHAVLLDTAGRLVFEDVKPGETSEWKEFLKLLRSNRPHCPINGLLLVIPSDSLIKDSSEEIATKAGKIAQQLDVIQRILDFRFPVYVVVTKSDKINGFREFFENVTDPQLQHQMMGWSNTEPLDAPFKAELVERHLQQVTERLRRRRLGLLRDPVPEGAARRVDEVDSLFALPSSLLSLTPRLRRYLETIFMPGEWSAKPLFLRGIYFTSSMREGAALDQELAEAIGISADQLPEGKVWERERAYFLRDLFMEKAFKEKGLVTQATNTREMLRRRRLLIYASSFVALTVFLVLAWFSMKTLRQEVQDRRDYWAAATKIGWDNGDWARPVVKWDEENGVFTLVTNKFSFVNDKLTLGEIHKKFRELAENNIQGRWTSPALAASYNSRSKNAQRILFETGVIKPLHDAAVRIMRNPTTDAARANQSDALALLIRLEGNVLSRAQGNPVDMDVDTASNFLGVLSQFVTGSDASQDSNLVATMVWTYTVNPAGRNTWPPAWLSTMTTTPAGVPTNTLLDTGLDFFISTATNTKVDVRQVTDLETAVQAYEKVENTFLQALNGGNRADALARMDDLKSAKAALDGFVANAAKGEFFKKSVTFNGALQALTNRNIAFGRIERADTEALRNNPNNPVFASISNHIVTEKRVFSASLLNTFTSADLQEFARLDARFLGPQGDSSAYQQRWLLYDRSLARDLDAQLGFPLLRDAKNVLPTDGMDALSKSLDERGGELAATIKNLNLQDSGPWPALKTRIDDLKNLAVLLQGKNGQPDSCTVSLVKVDDPTDSAEKWRGRYRAIRLASAGTAPESIKIESDETQELGKVDVDKAFTVQLFQLDSDKTAKETLTETAPWGPLALIAKYQGTPEKEGDGKTWIVLRPVPGVDGNFIRLRLVFDDPLPDLKHWPAQ
jgi:GTP-binding protein EngB required for normal cell division